MTFYSRFYAVKVIDFSLRGLYGCYSQSVHSSASGGGAGIRQLEGHGSVARAFCRNATGDTVLGHLAMRNT